MNYLKLVRVKNLIFIVILQLVMQQAVLMPILQKYGFDYSSVNLQLILLIVATVCIAAGGYVLNDYFDVKIDAINRPERLIVNRLITKRNAMIFYLVITALGVISGLILAYLTRSFTLMFIFVVVPGLLWFYSSSYKRQFMIGNLIVSFSAALTVLVVAISELAVLQLEYGNLIYETPIPGQFYLWIGGFSFFSFLVSWLREIIKDMEDVEGDRELECRTMPIKWGITKSKWFVYFLILITVASLLVINTFIIEFQGNLTLRYIIFGLIIPLTVMAFLTNRAKNSFDFHRISTFLKFIMFIGVMYGLIFYYLMAKTYNFPIFDLFLVK